MVFLNNDSNNSSQNGTGENTNEPITGGDQLLFNNMGTPRQGFNSMDGADTEVLSANSDASAVDPDMFERIVAERDHLFDQHEQGRKKQEYLAEILSRLTRYRKLFDRFFNTHCLEEAKLFIQSKPKESFADQNYSLTNSSGEYPVDFAVVNKVLQDPKYDIRIAQVFNLAFKLGVGSIKAEYTGKRTQDASYGDCGGSSGDWLFSCVQKRVWADYDVNLTYFLPDSQLCIPLLSLKFENHLANHRYQVQVSNEEEIEGHASSARANAAAANREKLEVMLQNKLPGSKLVAGEDAIKYHEIKKESLSTLINEVAKRAIGSSREEAQGFRREIVEARKEFLSMALDRRNKQLSIIFAYVGNYAKISEKNWDPNDPIARPIEKEDFLQDLIRLGTREHGKKCNDMVTELDEHIQRFLLEVKESEVLSDEEGQGEEQARSITAQNIALLRQPPRPV